MTKKAFDKIMGGLRDALDGRWARAVLYKDGMPVQQFTLCRGCGGLTLTIRGRCESCGDRKLSIPSTDHEATS